MGSVRNLSSERKAQAVALANADYRQIHIGRVLCMCAKAKKLLKDTE